MTENPGHAPNSPDARAVSPWVIAAVGVLLVAFLVWLAYRNFGPFGQPKTFTVKEQKDWVTERARATQGDFTRLSPEEQKKLNGISFGNGATYLRRIYEKQTTSPNGG
jgi:hypothetical protein